MSEWNVRRDGIREVANAIKLRLMASKGSVPVYVFPKGEVVIGGDYSDESLLGTYNNFITVREIVADLKEAMR